MIRLYHASRVEMTGDDSPADIQWMPPGLQEARCADADGNATVCRVLVDEDAANVVEKARAEAQKASDSGDGDAPFIDFNHDDAEAAGWVTGIYWGGDDPQTGGIRARVEWSDLGLQAVKGRRYRRFSPSWACGDPDDDGIRHITGATVNMGGLVNRAGFAAIQNLSAKGPDPEAMANNTTNTTMTDDEIKSLQDEIAVLKSENEQLKMKLESLNAKCAEEKVDEAVADGRIQEEHKAKWLEEAKKSPGTLDLLAKLPKPTAPGQIFTAKDTAQKTSGGMMAKYEAIADPVERLAFYRAHKSELLNERG